MNPMLMGLMAMMGNSNPDLFAQAMASQGVSPGMLGGGMPGYAPDDPLQSLFAGGGSVPQTMPGAPTMPSAPAASAAASPLSGLQGVKAPEQAKPVFSGGVSGAQGAPQMKAVGSSSVQDLISQLMLGRGGEAGQNPLRVPDLGALLKGV
jgi:hypothetical protein